MKGLSSDFSSFAATLLGTPCKSQWPDADYSLYDCDKHFAKAKKATLQLLSWERLASLRLWLPKLVGL